jgi:hypothetical protein
LTKINYNNYFVMFVLIFSAFSMGQSSVFTPAYATSPVIDAAVPNSGVIGQSVHINFNNLIATHSVTIKFNNVTSISNSTVNTNSTGGWKGTVTVPIGAGNNIYAYDGTSHLQTAFTVDPTPNLGTSGTFGVLANTYTNGGATFISGDLGYTTPPGVAATITGTLHVSDGAYNAAGTAQNAAIASLNALTCTSNLGNNMDLSLINGSIYSPGVYCATGGTSTGKRNTLIGHRPHIFILAGALN